MKNDESEPDTRLGTEARLEARILAWVCGEATAEESARLARMAAEDPRVAAERRRLEALLPLVVGAVRPDERPMAMAAARRESLMRALAAPADGAARKPATAHPSLETLAARQRRERRWILAAAACLSGSILATVFFRSQDRTGTVRSGERVSPAEQASVAVGLPAQPEAESVAAASEESAAANAGSRNGSVAAPVVAANPIPSAPTPATGDHGPFALIPGEEVAAGEDTRAARAEFPDSLLASGSGAGGALPGSASDGTSPASGEQQRSASADPVSTLSFSVGDASFREAKEALAEGRLPDASGIRPEEFYNGFDYGDPAPSLAERVSCQVEQAADLFRRRQSLVRIAMRVPMPVRAAAAPLRLTVLFDTSAAMGTDAAAAAATRTFGALVSILRRDDRVTLVGFSGRPTILAEQVEGDRAAELLDIVAHTRFEGGSDMDQAVRLGGDLARRHYVPSAENRILLVGGAPGPASGARGRLYGLVEDLGRRGISFDACLIGPAGAGGAALGVLASRGSGHCLVVRTPDAADAGLARRLAGALWPAAENVKLQVRFNPSRVGSYRLIGFDRPLPRGVDFRDDRMPSGSLGGGEAAVAVYEVVALPNGEGDLGRVSVRFREGASGPMVERSWPLAYHEAAPAFGLAPPSMQLAGASAYLAERLRAGAYGRSISLSAMAPVMASLRGRYPHQGRVQELVSMFEEARRLAHE